MRYDWLNGELQGCGTRENSAFQGGRRHVSPDRNRCQ